MMFHFCSLFVLAASLPFVLSTKEFPYVSLLYSDTDPTVLTVLPVDSPTVPSGYKVANDAAAEKFVEIFRGCKEREEDISLDVKNFEEFSVPTGFSGSLSLAVSKADATKYTAAFKSEGPRNYFLFDAVGANDVATANGYEFAFDMPTTPATRYTIKLTCDPQFVAHPNRLHENNMHVLGWTIPTKGYKIDWAEPSQPNDSFIFKVLAAGATHGAIYAFSFAPNNKAYISYVQKIPAADLADFDPRSMDMKFFYSLHKATTLSYPVLHGTVNTLIFVALAIFARFAYRKVFVDVGEIEEEEDEEERAFRVRQEEELKKKNKKIIVKRPKKKPVEEEGAPTANEESPEPNVDEQSVFGDAAGAENIDNNANTEETVHEGEGDFFDLTSTRSEPSDNDPTADEDFFDKEAVAEDSLRDYGATPKRKFRSDAIHGTFGASLLVLVAVVLL